MKTRIYAAPVVKGLNATFWMRNTSPIDTTWNINNVTNLNNFHLLESFRPNQRETIWIKPLDNLARQLRYFTLPTIKIIMVAHSLDHLCAHTGWSGLLKFGGMHIRWHYLQNKEFKIRALEFEIRTPVVWSWACYLAVAVAPDNIFKKSISMEETRPEYQIGRWIYKLLLDGHAA